jgi:hypothetical protein
LPFIESFSSGRGIGIGIRDVLRRSGLVVIIDLEYVVANCCDVFGMIACCTKDFGGGRVVHSLSGGPAAVITAK